MQTQNLPLTKIKPNPSNPRTIKGDKFEKLVNSIQEFPRMLEIRPIVINDDNVILGGNMRLEACKKAGLKEVPVLKASDLSADEQRQFIIKDNVGFGEWDWDLLANEWDNEQLEEWGLDVWQPDDVTELEAEEDDYEAPSDIQTKIIEGDLIEIGQHRLLCGDSTDSDKVSKLMNGEKADMVFTDPDYSMNNDDLFACYANTLAFLKTNFSFWVCADKQAVSLAKNDFDNFTHFFIHNFKVPTMTSGTQPMTKHNMICKFGNKKMNNLKDGFSTIVDVATERTLESHKVTRMSKRVELPALFIQHYTQIGEGVLDVFLHSGSTMVAAHQLKRKCYGMELDPKYCQVIIDRMLKLDPELDVRINGKAYT